MFWRSNMHSALVVGAVAMVLALGSDGIFGAKCFKGVREFGGCIKGAVVGIHTSVDDLVTSEPVRQCAGPTFLLVASDGDVIGLDREGIVASRDTACCRSDLPALTGFAPASVAVGERVSSAEIVVGLEVVRAFEGRPEMMKVLSEVNLEDLENPRAILSGGVTVSLGQGDYCRKIEKLNQVLLYLKRLKASPKTIDLRFSRQVVVKCSEPKPNSEKEV
jgi:hypothetical protein